ncbi:MAG: hypothetical protein R2867_20035 [Caldilineaceae bacterium]
MTSFGPHVHWEIHHTERGRVRNDLYFSRSAITYCKFCAADGSAVQNVAANAYYAGTYYGGAIFSREILFALALLLLGATIFFRPELVAAGLHRAGALLHRTLTQTQTAWQRAVLQRRVHWTSLLLAFLLPAFLCSSGTALAVWMADEQIDPRTVFAYLRFGLYPYIGEGYQVGARYSAVWGIPCHGVGTLGQVCQTADLVETTLTWQRDVAQFTRAEPIPVAIARLEGSFDLTAARRLLNEMHYANGLAIIDVSSNFKKAHDVVDELTGFGLDGVAIDMEFADTIRQRDIYWLAERMAEKRKAAGLPGKGVLVLWNVFHNLDDSSHLDIDGVQIIPIFTGYGPTDTKVAGLAKTQKLFGVEPLASGVMAFDKRWPINRRCKTFNTTLGFDCQDWRVFFANPATAGTGWWVQQ